MLQQASTAQSWKRKPHEPGAPSYYPVELGDVGKIYLFQSEISSLPLIARGKVRDIYAVGDDALLIVTTDRLSAFDVILPDPIPDKGRTLNTLSNFWFARLAHVIPNHLTGIGAERYVTDREQQRMLHVRSPLEVPRGLG